MRIAPHMHSSDRKSEGIRGAWVSGDVFQDARDRTSWAAALDATDGVVLAAHPSKAATTHVSPMATASAIRTSRRFSRLMGGFMLDTSAPDIGDDRCAGRERLRNRDGIAVTIGQQDIRQLLRLPRLDGVRRRESPHSAIAAVANLLDALASPPGRHSGSCTSRTLPCTTLQQLVCLRESSQHLVGVPHDSLAWGGIPNGRGLDRGQIAPKQRTIETIVCSACVAVSTCVV